MAPLRNNEDGSSQSTFGRYKYAIFDKVVEAIEKSQNNPDLEEVEVMTIVIDGVEYTIHILRRDFVSSLEAAIALYEEAEDYEKCQRCFNLLEKQNP
jgi:hypothetical protein